MIFKYFKLIIGNRKYWPTSVGKACFDQTLKMSQQMTKPVYWFIRQSRIMFKISISLCLLFINFWIFSRAYVLIYLKGYVCKFSENIQTWASAFSKFHSSILFSSPFIQNKNGPFQYWAFYNHLHLQVWLLTQSNLLRNLQNNKWNKIFDNTSVDNEPFFKNYCHIVFINEFHTFCK